MKKIIFIIALFCFSIISVNAATITVDESSAKYKDKEIKVTGTSTEADVQVAIFDGDTLVLYGVATVTAGEFSYTSPKIDLIKDKTYTIKIASLDGATTKTTTFVAGETTEKTPETLDNVFGYIITGIIFFLALCGIGYFAKRKKIN